MAIRIFLRSTANKSHFKEALLKILSKDTLSELLICSGYIQEDLFSYSVLDENLLDSIKKHPNKANLLIKVIGGKFDKYQTNQWETSFNKFINKLHKEGIKYNAYKAKNKNWHAKIIIGKCENEYLAAIIGSSNLTRPAYSDSTIYFNFECDVLLINDNFLSVFDGSVAPSSDDAFSPIATILDSSKEQPDEIERIYALYEELHNDDLENYNSNLNSDE